ncbi:MAG: TetR/AcrR family transcriptional regulator [Actinomycetota bacterium]|nr:TetR/AcrR family transcriptional regulator [Actinomycetota bacterium]
MSERDTARAGRKPDEIDGTDESDGTDNGSADERHQIIAAGAIVLARSAEARVVDIVRAAGVSNNAFYRHFTSKDELVVAVVRSSVGTMVDDLRTLMAGVEDPGESIRIWVHRVLRAARRPDPDGPATGIVRHGRRLEWHHVRECRDVLAEPLLAPLRALGRRLPEHDAALIVAGVIGVLIDQLHVETGLSDAEVDDMATFYLRALGTP